MSTTTRILLAIAIAFVVGLWLFVSRHKRSRRGGLVSAGEAHSGVDVTKMLAKKAQPVLGWSMTLLGLVLMIPTTTVFALGMPSLGSVGGGLMAGLAVGLVLFLLCGPVGVVGGGLYGAMGFFQYLGLFGMTGVLGGTAGGFFIKTVTVSAVSPIIWLGFLGAGVCLLARLPRRSISAGAQVPRLPL